jgi:hypothetical protein
VDGESFGIKAQSHHSERAEESQPAVCAGSTKKKKAKAVCLNKGDAGNPD